MPWFGHRILAGEVPYRDFFLHLPPLHPLAEAALEALVGKSILAGRIAGAFGHVLMAALVAAWLARRFRPATAVVTTIAALALACSDDTEILDLYNPHASLAAIASGLLACVALDGGRWARVAGWSSGAAAGVAFWTKQTVGLGATVAVPVALGMIALGDAGARAELRRLAMRFAGGWGALALAIAGWLAAFGGLAHFVRQVFLGAAGSKGSPLRLLVRPWIAPLELTNLVRPAIIAAAIAVFTVAIVGLREQLQRPAARPWRSSLLGLGIAVLLLELAPRLATSLPGLGSRQGSLAALRDGLHLGVLFSLYGVTALGLLVAWFTCRERSTGARRELTIFVCVAGAIALTHSLSFAATGAAGFPALALFVTYAIDGLEKRRWGSLLALPAAVVVTMTLVAAVEFHRRSPFDFAGWSEPSSSQSIWRSREPALAGLHLSKVTVRTVEGVLAALRSATDPGEAIFTFPVYPIFHWLADRPAATFASLHWIDVTPDDVVERDLATLLAEPPVAVVRQWQEEQALATNERYFRAGRESAFRRMHLALDRLLAERYRKVYVSPPRRYRVKPRLEVWVRADRVAQRGLESLE